MKVVKCSDFLLESFGMSQQGMNPSTSFGYTDLDTVNTGGSVASDQSLNSAPWDEHKKSMNDQFTRLGNILKTVFNNSTMNLSQEFADEIKELYILKVFNNNNNALDVYIRFHYNDDIYYGKFKNWGTHNKPVFTSDILNLPIMGGQENKIRLIGMLETALNIWFKPEVDAKYRCLKEIKTYDYLGRQFFIPYGGLVEVCDVIGNDKIPTIFLKYDDKTYTFTGLDYYFFNWWFKPEEKIEYYL